MRIHLSAIFFVFIFFLSLPSIVFAQNNRLRVNEDQALPAPQTAAQADLIIPIPILVEQLNIKLFDAAQGDLSICLGEAPCLYFAQQIKSWRCASNVCEQGEGGTRPATCFADQFRDHSYEDQTKISQAVCSIVKSPGKDARMALLDLVPGMSDHVLVENAAYLWAFKGNVDQCVDVIKNAVGEFGPNWNFRWYRALSGCRILAQESTREKEEKDYHKWLSLERGEGKCSEIKNRTLREACEAPGAASPKPGFEFLPGISSLDGDTMKALLDLLNLKMFLNAASDDPSLCGDDQYCLIKMGEMKSFDCVDRICDSIDKSKEPTSCFEDRLSNVSTEIRNQINEAFCPLIKSPGKNTRQAFINAIRPVAEAEEASLVSHIAHQMAVKGDSKSCQEHIKDYLGPYGLQWKSEEYVNLSACRILARESTYEQERKDFASWFAVAQGVGNCSGIINSELRNACNTPGATFPKPVAKE